MYIYVYICIYMYTNICSRNIGYVGVFIKKVRTHYEEIRAHLEYRLFYRALLQKSPIILCFLFYFYMCTNILIIRAHLLDEHSIDIMGWLR